MDYVCSQVVTHPTNNAVKCGLTSEILWDQVYPALHGPRQMFHYSVHCLAWVLCQVEPIKRQISYIFILCCLAFWSPVIRNPGSSSLWIQRMTELIGMTERWGRHDWSGGEDWSGWQDWSGGEDWSGWQVWQYLLDQEMNIVWYDGHIILATTTRQRYL